MIVPSPSLLLALIAVLLAAWAVSGLLDRGAPVTEFANARWWKRPWCWLRGHRWWGGLGMYACVRCDKDWHE